MRAPRIPKSPDAEPSAARERFKSTKRDPELEAAIGARVRAARLAARMSQGDLGAAVGLTYQQVQKYETGKDRVPASTLMKFAAAMGVHLGSFFDDDMPVPVGAIPDVKAAMRAADVLQQIRDPRVLKQLLVLSKMLADVVPAFENLNGASDGTT